MFLSLDHIALAVQNLEESIQLYEEVFGLTPLGKEEVESEKIKVATLDGQNTTIELIEPTSVDSPIQKFLDKKGEGLHHLCFAVECLEEVILILLQRGVQFIEPVPRVGSGGSRVAFIHPKSTGGVLIELKEKQVKNA